MNTATGKGIATAEPLTSDFGLTITPACGVDPCELPLEEVTDACKSSGVVYFRGFDYSMSQFETFTNLQCQDWLTYKGGAHDRQVLNPGSDKSVYSVNFYLGQKEQLKFELPLHCDMSYLKESPVALYFYCVQPAAARGETMLCDGAAVFDNLAPATRKLLESQKIVYIRKYPEGNWQTRFGTSDLEDVRAFCQKNFLELRVDETTGTLYTDYAVSAVPHSRWLDRPVFRNSILPVVKQEEIGLDDSLVRLEDGSPLPAEVIADIREVTTRLTALVPMLKGDFMFVDNTRVLHGRKAFDDAKREVAIRMAKSLTW